MEYGIDWDGPLVEEEGDADQVTVQESDFALSEEDYETLQEEVQPLANSQNYGLFMAAVSYIEDNLQQ